MAYFVTGATGFIGRFLGRQPAEARRADLRARAQEFGRRSSRSCATTTGSATEEQVIGVVGDLGQAEPRRSPPTISRSSRARSRISSISPRSTICPRARRRSRPPTSTARATRSSSPTTVGRRLLPSRELDRRRRALRRRVSRGHVRGGRGPRPSVLQDQARFRRRGAQALQAAVPDLPSGLRRRRLEDRLHRQDRRTVLLLQVAAEAARRAAAVDADGRHRRRPHQHRSGRLRRRRARLSRAQEGPRRQVLPPDRSGARTGSARCSTSSPRRATRRR